MRNHFLILAIWGFAQGGCQSEDIYSSCEMNERMKNDCDFARAADQCQVYDLECYVACAVLEHPSCVEGPCVLYQYRELGKDQYYSSGPFCTKACSKDSDCPSGGRCLPMFEKKYCVPSTSYPVSQGI
jgi:hypothetical protein